MYINNLILKDKSGTRKTSDLDFKIFKIDNIEEYLKKWCNDNKINMLKCRENKAGNYKIRLSCPTVNINKQFEKESFTIINIDLEMSEEFIKGVATYKEVMKEKLNLKLDLMDRRLKDLVDFIINLNLYYEEGISKKDVLDMINNPEKIEDICNESNQEDCLRQAKTFNPKVIAGIKVEDCISRFFIMLNGLIDSNVLEDSLFIDGYWTRI